MALVFLIVLRQTGGLLAPCDAPLPFWLWVSSIFAFAVFGAGLFVKILTCMFGPKDAEGKTKTPKLGKCILCLVCLAQPFGFYWYIQGNIWLWSTFPMNDLSNATLLNLTNSMEQGTIAEGLGCVSDM